MKGFRAQAGPERTKKETILRWKKKVKGAPDPCLGGQAEQSRQEGTEWLRWVDRGRGMGGNQRPLTATCGKTRHDRGRALPPEQQGELARWQVGGAGPWEGG